MPDLSELQAKYPTSKYSPQENCPQCHGEGERWTSGGSYIKEGYVPCMCIFVDHEHIDMIRPMFQETVTKLRKEIEEDIARRKGR